MLKKFYGRGGNKLFVDEVKAYSAKAVKDAEEAKEVDSRTMRNICNQDIK
ncbi:MAG: hypothetical protein ACI4UM_04150 [Succinivibrio sp.]